MPLQCSAFGAIRDRRTAFSSAGSAVTWITIAACNQGLAQILCLWRRGQALVTDAGRDCVFASTGFLQWSSRYL